MKRMLTFIVVTLILSTPVCFASAMEVEIFKLKYRSADELLPLVMVALSENGSASVDKRTNSIVVKATPANMRLVRKVIAEQDLAPVNVTITVYEVGKNELSELGIDVDWKVQNGNLKAGNISGGRDGSYLSVTGGKTTHTSKTTSSRKIKVLSGSRAKIISGRKMAVAGSKYGAGVTHVQTGLFVSPLVMGDRVRLKVTPMLTLYCAKGVKEKRVASTELDYVLSKGGRILLGADNTRGTSTTTELFNSFSKSKNAGSSYILLQVDLEAN